MDRWLATRLQGQLGGETADPSNDDPTDPGKVRRGSERTLWREASAPDEDTEDPATVLALASGRYLSQFSTPRSSPIPAAPSRGRELRVVPAVSESDEDVEDAHTVRISRMPVSFIGESVTDPNTALDTSEAAARWREQGNVDEIDPMGEPLSLEPNYPAVGLQGERTQPRSVAARLDGARHPSSDLGADDGSAAVDGPSVSAIVIALLLGTLLGVGAVAVTAMLLF